MIVVPAQPHRFLGVGAEDTLSRKRQVNAVRNIHKRNSGTKNLRSPPVRHCDSFAVNDSAMAYLGTLKSSFLTDDPP